jgi:hypothetical protein
VPKLCRSSHLRSGRHPEAVVRVHDDDQRGRRPAVVPRASVVSPSGPSTRAPGPPRGETSFPRAREALRRLGAEARGMSKPGPAGSSGPKLLPALAHGAVHLLSVRFLEGQLLAARAGMELMLLVQGRQLPRGRQRTLQSPGGGEARRESVSRLALGPPRWWRIRTVASFVWGWANRSSSRCACRGHPDGLGSAAWRAAVCLPSTRERVVSRGGP